MDEPPVELRADAAERTAVPEFDTLVAPADLVRGDRTRDDFFDAALGLESPATTSEVAELAGHGVDAAREYLEWFERIGIVIQRTDSPATYERNQAYLDWRRVQTLRREYTQEALLDLLETDAERAAALRAEFDAPAPDAVSLTAYSAETGHSIEETWDRLSTWRTVRRRIALLERALTESGDGAGLYSAV
ncbi:DUF7342 family protein [Natronobiforma cellulositropha]|uniref:DUF7342 family protein n=1 Tax=Natronobiforma cellulositropha TaxID=1679076 RepID=UPI0021D59CEC|nr:hypothetical protein [Natronobiforma cellulositropha]